MEIKPLQHTVTRGSSADEVEYEWSFTSQLLGIGYVTTWVRTGINGRQKETNATKKIIIEKIIQ